VADHYFLYDDGREVAWKKPPDATRWKRTGGQVTGDPSHNSDNGVALQKYYISVSVATGDVTVIEFRLLHNLPVVAMGMAPAGFDVSACQDADIVVLHGEARKWKQWKKLGRADIDPAQLGGVWREDKTLALIVHQKPTKSRTERKEKFGLGPKNAKNKRKQAFEQEHSDDEIDCSNLEHCEALSPKNNVLDQIKRLKADLAGLAARASPEEQANLLRGQTQLDGLTETVKAVDCPFDYSGLVGATATDTMIIFTLLSFTVVVAANRRRVKMIMVSVADHDAPTKQDAQAGSQADSVLQIPELIKYWLDIPTHCGGRCPTWVGEHEEHGGAARCTTHHFLPRRCCLVVYS